MMGSLATIPQPTLLALAAVIIIGLPHGALDGAIAIYLGYSKRIVLLLRFVLLYVVAAALVVAAWMAAPAVCLLIFLVISMLHFGLGDARPGGGWAQRRRPAVHTRQRARPWQGWQGTTLLLATSTSDSPLALLLL